MASCDPIAIEINMITQKFAQLSELVDDIKATGDATIAAIACRALGDILNDDPTSWREEIEA